MAPITRICSALILALLAGSATARMPERSALLAYVQARSAAAEGESETALSAYAAALEAEPGNDLIAARAFREAVASGDRALALLAANQLEQLDKLPADANLLLIGSHLQARDVAGAQAILAKLEAEKQFEQLLPVIRSWVGIAARNPLAPELINGTGPNGLGTSMTVEQRAFASLVAGRMIEGLSLIKSSTKGDGRSAVTRMVGAATFQKMGDPMSARQLIEGPDPSFVLARHLLDEKRPIGGAIDTPVKGLAFFYARLASDMARNRVPFFAMTLGRYARFLDPDSPLIALTEAQGLAANDEDQAALKSLNTVDPSGPYASIADESRISLLQRLGLSDEAAHIALATAQASSNAADYVQLGDVLNQQGKYRDAAAAYDRALAASPASSAPDDWGIWLLKGNVLVQAGDWPAGEAALRKALSLAPDQPSILNLLGYALLERRQSIDEAKQLIARAAGLKPGDAAITDSLGWAYYLSGDFERAVSTLETAALADENEPTIREHLGDAYWRNGQRVAARYAWKAALLLAEGEAASRLAEKADFGLTAKTEAR
ncbi:MAG: hypothetical protein RLZZ561_1784 [Pseudomonadota bacterium]